MTEEANAITFSPVLVYVGETLYLKIGEYLMKLQSNRLAYGIDLLFKTYFALDINYPDEISYFFQFLEIVSEIKVKKQVPSILELEMLVNAWVCAPLNIYKSFTHTLSFILNSTVFGTFFLIRLLFNEILNARNRFKFDCSWNSF